MERTNIQNGEEIYKFILNNKEIEKFIFYDYIKSFKLIDRKPKKKEILSVDKKKF